MMTNISTYFGESTSNVDDLPRDKKNTKNVLCEEPPRYQSLCSKSINYPSTPITVCPSYSTSAFIDTQSEDKIKSHILWSIFNIFCCCLCLGCFACYYSNKTTRLKRRGDLQGALVASTIARTLNVIGTMFGIFFIFTYFFRTAYILSRHRMTNY